MDGGGRVVDPIGRDGLNPGAEGTAGLTGWRALVAAPRFQAAAARLPLIRRLVRRDGEAMMEVVAGFVHSQILLAAVEIGVFDALAPGPLTADDVARETGLHLDRATVLLDGAVALEFLSRRRGRYRLARRGAALLGVPGLAEMIKHNAVLYGDLSDAVGFFRGETQPALARFWPYVLGGVDAAAAERYSTLMAESQALVAEETLQAVRLAGVRHLMDLGGGTGAFLAAVARRRPDLRLTLADLPAVIDTARQRVAALGLSDRIEVVAADFRDGLPMGADAISLIRVLYDHDDATVAALLSRVRSALPPGGRIIVSEPMLGTKAGDTYFAVYTLAMGTGRTRSPARIKALLGQAGFVSVRRRRTTRPFVSGVIEARVPETVSQD